MRALIVTALAGLAIPLAFVSPILGLLAYCWLSYMRPQELAFGIAHISFGLYVAIALFLGIYVRMKWDFFRLNRVTLALLGVWAVWGVSTYFAYDRSLALEGLDRITTVVLIGLVATGLCTTPERVKWFAVAIAGSLAFHGVKKGLWGVASGGSRDLNMIGGMMSGNNENATALNMALPFLVCWAAGEKRQWKRWALWGAAALTTVAIICTYSRGGFLGLAAGAAVLAWRSRHRMLVLTAGVPVAVALFATLAPQEFLDRIGGIDDASRTDLSAMYRLRLWEVAWNIGLAEPWTGIGPRCFLTEQMKFPRPADLPQLEVHSTWFELVSTVGFTGLAAYVAMLWAGFSTSGVVLRETKLRDAGSHDARLDGYRAIAVASQAGLAAYTVSCTFGSLAHFDLPYHIACVAACNLAVMRTEAERMRVADAEAIAANVLDAPANGFGPANGFPPAGGFPPAAADTTPTAWSEAPLAGPIDSLSDALSDSLSAPAAEEAPAVPYPDESRSARRAEPRPAAIQRHTQPLAGAAAFRPLDVSQGRGEDDTRDLAGMFVDRHPTGAGDFAPNRASDDSQTWYGALDPASEDGSATAGDPLAEPQAAHAPRDERGLTEVELRLLAQRSRR
ncbi:MAG: hypothetical protein HMLKMBBP_03321 [Planctomycetes bacterium]|nr:hypothetical protein [Planctomycetota bacterium]